MPYNIEILSVGSDFDALIAETSQLLNGVQEEFRFRLAPKRMRQHGREFVKSEYVANDVFDLLKKYRDDAKGQRPYLLAVVNGSLRSQKLANLFGSHDARDGTGEAVVTLRDRELYTDSAQLYLCYYFIRYALSFVCPALKNHDDTRSCFFDKKLHKADIKESMDSGGFCQTCRAALWKTFNEEINVAIQCMIEVLKALSAGSQAHLAASSVRGHVDVGIITIREDEFEAMLQRFPSQRHVKGTGSTYQYSKVRTTTNSELRVAVARSPEQGQGAAQALASSMINDLAPDWIFVVGIAGGFPSSESTLGDVLLSQRMHDFAVSAAIEGKPPEFQDMGGPMALDVEKLVTGLKGLRARLGPWGSREFLGKNKPKLVPPKSIRSQSLYGDAAWKRKVLKALKTQFPLKKKPRGPEFFAAVIIAGNTLLKDTKLATLWKKTARHASGVEMELGGVCRAARYGGAGGTRVLAVRGLSDIVGYERSPEWTDYACRAAAAFTDALLRSGLISPNDTKTASPA